MEPLAIVTAFLAALIVLGRGGLVVAPRATVDFYLRLFSSPGRLRALGVAGLVLVAAPLIFTARQAPVAVQETASLLEALGWIAATGGVLLIAAPGAFQHLGDSIVGTPDSVLRGFGLLAMAFGLLLGWVAFFVL